MESLGNDERDLEARLEWLRKGWWPVKLEVPVGRNILAVSPHPDDETIGAGGLLIAHRDVARISVVSIFNGEAGGLLPSDEGGDQHQKEDLVAVRRRELAAACSHFGGHVLGGLDLPDGSKLWPLQDAARQTPSDG